jgi:hypothetical protein
MSYEDKIMEQTRPYLQPGERMLAALVARARRSVARRGRSRARLLAVSGAGALAITAVAALAPGGPAALAFSDFNPAITVADGNSVIAVHTSGDGLRFYCNEFGTNNWHGEQVAADGTTYSDPAMAQNGNTTIIAAEGPSNSLDFTGRSTAPPPGTPRSWPAPGPSAGLPPCPPTTTASTSSRSTRAATHQPSGGR